MKWVNGNLIRKYEVCSHHYLKASVYCYSLCATKRSSEKEQHQRSVVNCVDRSKKHHKVMLILHITPEAPLSALKSAIAENGMGVTSRP